MILQTTTRYYVIIGSFDVQENADNVLKSMIAEGKQSYKIYDKSNNRFYIYIDYSLEEATAKKVQTDNPQYEGIWVKQIE